MGMHIAITNKSAVSNKNKHSACINRAGMGRIKNVYCSFQLVLKSVREGSTKNIE
jgi:hypothetical protein